jgi:hypothetical protein
MDVSAGPIGLTASTFVCVDTSHQCGLGSRFHVAPNPAVTFHTNQTLSGPGFSLHYHTDTQSDFGRYNSFNESSYTGTIAASAAAHTSSLDLLTITSTLVPNGTPGRVGIMWTFSGDMSDTGAAVPNVFVESCLGPLNSLPLGGLGGPGCQQHTFFGGTPFQFVFQTRFSFVFGVPSEFRNLFVTNVSFSGPGSGLLDYFHTFTLSGLEVTTVSGQPVGDLTFTSGSGTVYSENGVAAVPEPGSMVLLGTGIALVGRLVRRTRQSRPASRGNPASSSRPRPA